MLLSPTTDWKYKTSSLFIFLYPMEQFCANLSKFAHLKLQIMKKTFTLIICISISIFSFGQKEVTLEDIWQNYKFYPSGVSGFKSMNNGEHYTTTENTENGIKINKNSFETGEVVETLLDSEDERLLGMGSYQFNLSEDKILIGKFRIYLPIQFQISLLHLQYQN